MLVRTEPFDEKNTVIKEGVLPGKAIHLEYRLTETVFLALTGQTDALKERIRKGMPVSGFDRALGEQLLREMHLAGERWNPHYTDHTIYLNWKLGEETLDAAGKIWGRPQLLRRKLFITTMDAALAGGQLETLKLLRELGGKLSLADFGQQEMFFACEDEATIQYVIREEAENLVQLDLKHLFLEYGWNLPLIRALFEEGVRPETAILDKIAVGRKAIQLGEENDKDYLQRLAILRETPTGQFLEREGYRQIHQKLEDFLRADDLDFA